MSDAGHTHAELTRVKRTRWRTALAVGGGYALIVVLMTLPASLHLSKRLIGNSIDNWIFYWNNWWLDRAITEGHDWFFSLYNFYPQGASLIAHAHCLFNSLLAFALRPLAGPIFAYNLTVLLGLWLSAVSMFLLVYDLTHHRAAAFLAGFVFAFAPYHLTKALAHMHLFPLFGWAFYAFFLRRALCGREIKDALCAALFAALTFWTGLHLALMLALWTALYVVWQIVTRQVEWSRAASVLGIVVICAGLLCSPIIIPAIKNWSEVTDAPLRFNEQATRQTDLLAYLVPPTYNPLIGDLTVPLYERFIANRAFMPYLGFAAIALALIALLKRPKEAAFWTLSGGLWLLLAMGAVLRINGNLYPQVPLPYRFLGWVFPLSMIRAPDRLNLLLVFTLSTLTGIGAAWLGRRHRWWLLPLALVTLLEYLCVPIPMWELPPSSPFFEQMASEEANYGVLDYPMDYDLTKLWLYYQTIHGKPLIQGHVSRYSIDNYAFILSQPLLQALYHGSQTPPYLFSPDDTDVTFEASTEVQALGPELRALADAGTRYILVHKPYLDAERSAHLQHVLPLVPIYEDATIIAYDITQPFPVYYDGFPVPLTSEVALIHFDAQRADGGQKWRIQILTRLSNARSSPLACQVELVEDDVAILSSPATFFNNLPQIEWKDGDLDVREVEIPLIQELQPGTYHWTMTCNQASSFTSPRTLKIDEDGRTTYLRRTVNTRYGDDIQLEGYRWRTAGSDLHITLRWEALQQPQADYKFFVHLLDAGGEIVQQYDAMPCQWQCPTSQWQAREIVLDQVTMPLAHLPPEEYRLAVGVYVPETGERLPAHSPEGELYSDAYFILPDVFLIVRPYD